MSPLLLGNYLTPCPRKHAARITGLRRRQGFNVLNPEDRAFNVFVFGGGPQNVSYFVDYRVRQVNIQSSTLRVISVLILLAK